MNSKSQPADSRSDTVREATVHDAPAVARLMHDFNTEFSEPIPDVDFLTERFRRLIRANEVTVLLGGDEPVGLAVLRFRPSYYADALEAYLQELYVAPPRRGHGLGRALLEAAMSLARERGAHYMDLGTSEDDTAARALYESCGFTNREGLPEGPTMLYYEREL
jgi:ribosomal protein S18 acetylase RimI-like enzyme